MKLSANKNGKPMELPIWNDKYDKMGVTPEELYMRQHGLCWLRPEISGNGDVVIYCTDGDHKEVTATMLNPTIECVQCMMKFTTKAVQDAVDGCKPEIREDNTSGNDS